MRKGILEVGWPNFARSPCLGSAPAPRGQAAAARRRSASSPPTTQPLDGRSLEGLMFSKWTHGFRVVCSMCATCMLAKMYCSEVVFHASTRTHNYHVPQQTHIICRCTSALTSEACSSGRIRRGHATASCKQADRITLQLVPV